MCGELSAGSGLRKPESVTQNTATSGAPQVTSLHLANISQKDPIPELLGGPRGRHFLPQN